MKIIVQDIDVPPSGDVYLCYLTDTHLGAKSCEERLLRDDVGVIEKQKMYWIGGGDYIDCIARVGDRRYDEAVIADWLHGEQDVIGLQSRHWLETVQPIASHCLAMVSGNHEHVSYRHYGRDIYRDMVERVAEWKDVSGDSLQIGYQGFLVLRFRQGERVVWQSTIYMSHGYGGGRLPGGHALTLGRALGDYDADLVLMGHRHVRVYVDKIVVGASARGKMQQRLRQALFVPSYLNAYIHSRRAVDTYPELVGLPPQHLGTVAIRFHVPEKRIVVNLSNQPGLRGSAGEEEVHGNHQ